MQNGVTNPADDLISELEILHENSKKNKQNSC